MAEETSAAALPETVRMAEAARLVGCREADLLRLATEKKLTLGADRGRTVVRLDELDALYPGVRDRLRADLQSTSAPTQSSANAAAQPASPTAPETGSSADGASTSPSVINVDAGATGAGSAGGANESLQRARFGGGKYAGLRHEGTITPSRRGREGSRGGADRSVAVYSKARPGSVQRLQEDHNREIERLKEEQRQEVERVRQTYQQQVEELQAQVAALRQDNTRLKEEREHDTRQSEATTVARYRQYLDEAVTRAERLAGEVRALLELVDYQTDLIRQARADRDRAHRRLTYVQEVAQADRARLYRLNKHLMDQLKAWVDVRRRDRLRRLDALVSGSGADRTGNDISS